MTFVVRTTADAAGRLSGVVERVSTGEKRRFHGIEELSRVIEHFSATGRKIGQEGEE